MFVAVHGCQQEGKNKGRKLFTTKICWWWVCCDLLLLVVLFLLLLLLLLLAVGEQLLYVLLKDVSMMREQ